MSRAKVASTSYNQASKPKPLLSISGVSGQNIILGNVEILLRRGRECIFEFVESPHIMVEFFMLGILILRTKCSVATIPDSKSVVLKGLCNLFSGRDRQESEDGRLYRACLTC